MPLSGGVIVLLLAATVSMGAWQAGRALGLRAPIGPALGRVVEWVGLTGAFLVLDVASGMLLSSVARLFGGFVSHYAMGDLLTALLAAVQATAWQWWSTGRPGQSP